jgi:hypothetical protein
LKYWNNDLFCPEKPGPLGLRLVEPTPRRARLEFSGSALEIGVLNHKSQAPNYK